MKPKFPLLIPQPKSLKLLPRGGFFNLSGPIRTHDDPNLKPEAYRIKIGPAGLHIWASEPRGFQHARLTMAQIFAQCADPHNGAIRVPAMEIDDAPDFPHRGFMLDVSRGRVPKMETLFRLADLLHCLKYNQFQLYIEHTFAFKKHPLFGKGHSPFTPREIKQLDKYCRALGIELVPNLQSFGHAAHILKHKKYHPLAESEFRGGWTLSPVEKGTYKLLDGMYSDFLPAFSHQTFFNVGCDETWDLGRGKSKPLAGKIGLGRVYLGHLLKVHKLVRKRNMRMMFWGDIIEKSPELVPEIPEDVIVLNWEYETNGEEKRYRKRLEPARKAGREHWVCPGTSTWNS
ncbi:family 20 glycosylhydrolase, partial [Candidatus Sumerlaeota bacterium]|nr:family 20 glycosylhydrolase [Candidatus Sumerlaeota bacterium]